jgi:hypothetical protein
MESIEERISILLVEDDAQDEALIVSIAKRNGLNCVYERVKMPEILKIVFQTAIGI